MLQMNRPKPIRGLILDPVTSNALQDESAFMRQRRIVTGLISGGRSPFHPVSLNFLVVQFHAQARSFISSSRSGQDRQ